MHTTTAKMSMEMTASVSTMAAPDFPLVNNTWIFPLSRSVFNPSIAADSNRSDLFYSWNDLDAKITSEKDADGFFSYVEPPTLKLQGFPHPARRNGPLAKAIPVLESAKPDVSILSIFEDARDDDYVDLCKEMEKNCLLPAFLREEVLKTEQENETRQAPPSLRTMEEFNPTLYIRAKAGVELAKNVAFTPPNSPTKIGAKESSKPVKMVLNPMRPRNPPLASEKSSLFSVLMSNIPIGHYRSMIDLVKGAMEDLARSTYDLDYSAVVHLGAAKNGNAVLTFQRWIDLQLACAISPQKYMGRALKVKLLVMKDHFPEIDFESIRKEKWIKRVERTERDAGKEARYFMVWSEAMNLSSVAAMVKKATGKPLAFKQPITIAENQQGFFMKAANTADLLKVMLQLDGIESHRSGAVLRVRPWMHYDAFHKEIKKQVAAPKK
jgi:hypothetical protein